MSKIPSNLALTKPAWETVAYQGVPMFRAQAWALLDYELSGGSLIVNSADRRYGVAERFGKSSQKYLFENQHRPGFFPANPPGFSSHELRSDGNAVYGVSRGRAIPKHMLGIDAVNRPGGDAARIVAWLNSHGYRATRPYRTGSERHHFVFLRSPATNARRRLAKYAVAGGAPTLKRGAKSGYVIKLKKFLYDAGIRDFSGSPEKPNSNRFSPVFGLNTQRAVRRFQTVNKLTADGVVGPGTWRKLQGK